MKRNSILNGPKPIGTALDVTGLLPLFCDLCEQRIESGRVIQLEEHTRDVDVVRVCTPCLDSLHKKAHE